MTNLSTVFTKIEGKVAENIDYNLENTNKEKDYEETNKKVDEAISELSKMDNIKYLPLPKRMETEKQLSNFLKENNIRNLKKIRGNLEKQEQILKIIFPKIIIKIRNH